MYTITPFRYGRGIDAERCAKEYLLTKGYDLVKERYKTPHGEVDLIVTKDEWLVFVEVKFRISYIKGVEAITARQQKRISDAASLFLAQYPEIAHKHPFIRFDVVLVCPPDSKIRQSLWHIENAWQVEENNEKSRY